MKCAAGALRTRGPGERGKETAASSTAAQAAAQAAATAAAGLSRSPWRNIRLVVLLEEEEGMAGERRERRPSKTESRGMSPFPLLVLLPSACWASGAVVITREEGAAAEAIILWVGWEGGMV